VLPSTSSLRLEDHGVKLSACKKRKDYRACAREKPNPVSFCTKAAMNSNHGANNQLRNRADNDLRQRCRDSEPDRQQSGD
jgi:hypothetical protein